jgi:Kef-type K+ transport system membrane component KefB
MALGSGDAVVEILFLLFLMFVVARVLGRLVEKVGQPGVVGEILAGVLLGPSLLGLVDPANTGYGLTLEALAEIGIVVLLFSVGLETRIGDLKKVGGAASQTAVLGVVIPLLAGFALLLALGYDWHAALFVGAAMVATSVGITARVLGDLKVSNTSVAKVILGAAVIDDILGMIVLAVVGAVALGAGLAFAEIGLVVFEALIFVAGVLYFGPRVVGRIAGERKLVAGKRAYDRKRDLLKPIESREAALALAVAACLGLAAASSFFRLAPIIGAFLAGVAFADVEQRYELHHRLEPVRALLAPFFFVLMGTKVALGAFAADPALIGIAVVLTAVACVTKYYPCRFGARSMGPQAAHAVGIGMIPRGEVGLIVAAIALGSGIIAGPLFSVVVFMSLGTSIVAPSLLRKAIGAAPVKADRRMEVAKSHEWKEPEAPNEGGEE